ncbi:hypothetical protein [Nonomuraea monospora]
MSWQAGGLELTGVGSLAAIGAAAAGDAPVAVTQEGVSAADDHG